MTTAPAIRYRVNPGDVPAEKAARRLHLTEADFLAKLPELLRRGFPPSDPTTGMFDLDAINYWIDPPCGVYFVRIGEFVKIGWSTNIRRRMKSLQSASPHILYLLFTVMGEPSLEREYHRRFTKQRKHFEWFRVEGELRDFIAIEYALRGGAI